MRRGLLLSIALLASAASCERRLEGLPCQSDAKHAAGSECLRGYTCCDGACVSAPSSECLAANAGSGPVLTAGRDGIGARGGGAGRTSGGGAGRTSGGGAGRASGGGAGPEGGAAAEGGGGAVSAGGSTAGAFPVAGSGAFGGDGPAGAAGETSSGGHEGSDVAGAGGASGGDSASGGSGPSAAGSPSGGVAGSAGGGRGGAQELVRMTHDYPAHHLGGPGGSLFADVCPADQLLIGVEGHVAAGYLNTLAALCGSVRVEPSGGASPGTRAVRIDEGPVLPKRGVPAGTNTVSRCPADHVVVGLDTAFETGADELYYIRRLRVYCGALALVDDGGTSVIEVLPDADGLEPLLDWPERTGIVGPVTCGAGISRGLLVRAGHWVDGLALTCAEPLVARTNGSPCMRDEQCASGVCGDCGVDCRSCQPFECSAPADCRCSFFDSKHYLFCSGRRSHADAGNMCADAGGHLLYVDSKIENGWARSTASNAAAMAGEFWLGATDASVEGEFRWFSGAPALDDLEFWPAERRVGEELDCLQLNSDGQWQSGRCSDARPYLCELE